MRISRAELKANLGRYLDKVSAAGREVVVTERGKAVFRIIPVIEHDEDPWTALKAIVDSYDDPVDPVEAAWRALRAEA